MTATATQRLTQAEIHQYRTEGYTLPQGPVLAADKFQRLLAHFEKKLLAWPKDQRPEAMDTPHFGDPALNEWALDAEVVDLVEPLLGPDILLFSTHFICKPKGDGRRVPWHEDSAYWRQMLDPMEVATVWLALDPSTKINGCMNVIPRSHNTGKMGFSDYEGVDTTKSVFPSEIVKADRRDELAVACELQTNHCSLHDARTQHGSAANTSDIRRCGWTLRFIPATTRLSPAFFDRQLMYLARGKNTLGQDLADPSKDYSHVLAERKRQGFKAH